jgi:hypothetical protein
VRNNITTIKQSFATISTPLNLDEADFTFSANRLHWIQAENEEICRLIDTGIILLDNQPEP